MQSSSKLPAEFHRVRANILPSEFVDKHCNGTPRFVYGAMMLPTALKHHLQLESLLEIEKRMTPATLCGYKLCEYLGDGGFTPTIVPSSNPTDCVEGVLVFFSPEESFPADDRLMKLVNIKVTIKQTVRYTLFNEQIETTRDVEAGTLVWNGIEDSKDGGSLRENLLQEYRSSTWSLQTFLNSQFWRHMKASKGRQNEEARLRSES